jgi:hypothetical protein
MMAVAEGAKVATIEPKVGALLHRDNVIGIGGRFPTARRAAIGMVGEER